MLRPRARSRRELATVVVAVSLSFVLGTGDLNAQPVRVTGAGWVQSVDLRPLVEDSVPISQATGTGPYRQLADGRLVRCVEGEAYCRFRRSGDRITATPMTQDLQAAAWGLGQGLSLRTHLRVRGSLGDDELLWPRAEDRFDALEAYLQVERSAWRTRLGRQWAMNGLGVHNYDGGALLVRRDAFSIEAFGGVSLVEGLNESHTGDLLGELGDLPPEERGYLIGARGVYRFASGYSLSGTYERVIRADRGAFYSERVALDASGALLGTTFDASFAHDLVANEVNEARLRATRDLPARLSASIDLRRHRPFFESWTIWGAFSPVGFDEAQATLAWHDAANRFALDARGGWRTYDETSAGLESRELRTDGWRAGVGAQWTPDERWLAHAAYDVDVGFGASLSDAAGGIRWMPNERYSLGGTLSALQNIYEFRVGTGRVIGVALNGSARVTRDARVVLDGAVYSHTVENNLPSTDWSQRRFSLRFEWTLGGDPGERSRAPKSASERANR